MKRDFFRVVEAAKQCADQNKHPMELMRDPAFKRCIGSVNPQHRDWTKKWASSLKVSLSAYVWDGRLKRLLSLVARPEK